MDSGDNMIDLIQKRRREIEELCRRCHVRTLEVFGSAANGAFDPARSDLDFLVQFLPIPTGQHAEAYFGLLFGLEDLFGRKIDLVMPSAIRNRYFLNGVNQCREVVYAA
jgi:uncharacterized protein